MNKFILLGLFCTLFLVKLCASKPYNYQILPHKDGYVPVYIRYGNMPLDQIHPGLAEAFHEPVARSLKDELSHELQPVNSSSSEEKKDENLAKVEKVEKEKTKKESESDESSEEKVKPDDHTKSPA